LKLDKNALIIALIGAVITAVATIAPKVYDIVTEPKDLLTYSLSTSPGISEPTGTRHIVVVSVKNQGKKPLAKVFGRLLADSGQIEAFKVVDPSSISSHSAPNSSEMDINVDRMLPGDMITLSAMVSFGQSDGVPTFRLRSDDIVGVLQTDAASSPNDKNIVTTTFVAALAMFVSTIAVFMFRMSSGRTVFSSLAGDGDEDRTDFLNYMAIRLGLYDLATELRHLPPNLTYRSASDMLLALGKQATDKGTALKGLKCILLVSNIAETSISAIQKNISDLQGTPYSDAEVANVRARAASPISIDVRKAVDDVISGTLS
jgi:hypothetical protein